MVESVGAEANQLKKYRLWSLRPEAHPKLPRFEENPNLWPKNTEDRTDYVVVNHLTTQIHQEQKKNHNNGSNS